ncbi:MAG: bifunctional phosphopantothenoylcysteine decarboxylase/phosphopantothenate--cysteine ligase CoaBC [Candidatus Methylomirabilis oxygeniifera]|uniref:Coenzyme A biosynthesis bifunctional protein CoaBC n=1 Tax=Methylomirabilis oxygeniifera TaxID=671143 RepID=D5MIW2_METO1|nr:MAG: bifunctional phosphopantothenoylcysteine decarboxylase/phosphopantothenate--cysteine ligase CoaBC [Candidatus Methylomirabilis oxyfera]CBE69467.1 Coenzyme A biosynthesis bifunctional protein coaBC (DNA/pantothenate metabolism flavoprotein) [Includes: Phosphopantothenoylcysteine decarboxylase (CoaC); Phosphopantothenate--cysteine ligase (Phosphopantothenoylcysteine synthase) (CoaB)] [Candidatus Methylomirabilis oxyfera]
MTLAGKKIVLGVTGSIAAYKAVELVRALTAAEANVRVVMTASAQRFVTPLTLATLSRQAVLTDQSAWEAQMPHLTVARKTDLLLVAPATAGRIAKFAHGLADDLLSTLFLACTRPVVLAPAMDAEMYRHPVVQDNLARLRSWGVRIVGPATGELASGVWGPGRLAEISEIVHTVDEILGRQRDLSNEVVLITAGPTHEPLDPVRYLTTRASGKMGYALAEEAVMRGARTILISGPSSLAPPHGAECIVVETALQMRTAVLDRLAESTVIIKAAAVSDYRPTHPAESKLTKCDAPMMLELAPNPDILREIGTQKGARIVVGFAAETGELVQRARHKLSTKHLDLIVANDVTQEGAGFACETNRVIILDPDGGVEELPLLPKRLVAQRILDRVVSLRQQKNRV